jgi:flagellar hook-basal body complex protein FliE
MPAPVSAPIQPAIALARTGTPVAAPTSASAGFADLISEAINNVEKADQAAKTATADLLIGGKGEVHEVAIAAQRAELSLELFQQVRNKLVQAYQEVMRMPM